MNLKYIKFLQDEFLSTILGLEIEIRSAINDSYSISYDGGNKIIMSDNIGYYKNIKISVDGDDFVLNLNNASLCIKNNRLSKCNKHAFFNITRSRIGYRIMKGSKCLTIDNNHLILKKCMYGRLQEFVFNKIVPPLCKLKRSKNATSSKAKKFEKKELDRILDVEIEKHGIKNSEMKKIIKDIFKKDRDKSKRSYYWPKMCLFNNESFD